MAILRTLTPAIQVRTPPFEGPMTLRVWRKRFLNLSLTPRTAEHNLLFLLSPNFVRDRNASVTEQPERPEAARLWLLYDLPNWQQNHVKHAWTIHDSPCPKRCKLDFCSQIFGDHGRILSLLDLEVKIGEGIYADLTWGFCLSTCKYPQRCFCRGNLCPAVPPVGSKAWSTCSPLLNLN